MLSPSETAVVGGARALARRPWVVCVATTSLRPSLPPPPGFVLSVGSLLAPSSPACPCVVEANRLALYDSTQSRLRSCLSFFLLFAFCLCLRCGRWWCVRRHPHPHSPQRGPSRARRRPPLSPPRWPVHSHAARTLFPARTLCPARSPHHPPVSSPLPLVSFPLLFPPPPVRHASRQPHPLTTRPFPLPFSPPPCDCSSPPLATFPLPTEPASTAAVSAAVAAWTTSPSPPSLAPSRPTRQRRRPPPGRPPLTGRPAQRASAGLRRPLRRRRRLPTRRGAFAVGVAAVLAVKTVVAMTRSRRSCRCRRRRRLHCFLGRQPTLAPPPAVPRRP